MRTVVLMLFLAVLSLSGCKVREIIKTEYKDRIVSVYDTISTIQKDSVFIHQKGDTVWVEKYKTLFKDKIKVRFDSIYVNKIDTVVKKVVKTEVKEVQVYGFFWWSGLISTIILILYILFRVIKIIPFS